jgi:hypothetical protein
MVEILVNPVPDFRLGNACVRDFFFFLFTPLSNAAANAIDSLIAWQLKVRLHNGICHGIYQAAKLVRRIL